MPVTITFAATPRGHEYVRAAAHGAVGPTEAHQLMGLLAPGQSRHDQGLMAIVEAGSSFSPEARQLFAFNDASRNERGIPTAVVVSNAPLRVMMRFLFRMAGASQRAKLFSNELDAKNWFEETLDT